MTASSVNYRSRTVRALVMLHEQHLRAFAEVWKEAKARDVQLPAAPEDAYRSLDHLLFHVLDSAQGYLVRMCLHLGRPAPQTAPTPGPEVIASELSSTLNSLLDDWRVRLADVQDSDLEPEIYTPGMHYWIDAMLEHAVMHPVRHAFQLQELMDPPR
ncbi:DinB family protein [Deinococcus altitudinis]|uniref:DinB family protein n=1 Tax=Deinococcus altitudinis TaxID=468914 RepID=UPI003892C1AB